jgi:hypothetical protein
MRRRKNVKRLLGTLALAAALAAALVVPAAMAIDTKDAKGSACTDWVAGGANDAGYTFISSTNATVTANLQLAGSKCSGDYELLIYSFTSTGQGRPLVQGVEPSAFTETDSGTLVTFSYTFTSNAPSDGVCLAAESFQGGHVADRTPDTGCVPVPAGSSGASGFGG